MPTLSADGSRPEGHLRVDGLSAGYGSGLIISGIDISVGRTEIVTVIGPNGAGKSTLLKTITGQLHPAEGRMRLDDRDISGVRADRLARAGIGYVPQVRCVFGTLTVRENLEMGGYTLPTSQIAGRIDRVMTLFPLLKPLCDRQVGKLSGGERKMVAIGRVLMLEPSLIILDEPTAGLSGALASALLEQHVRQLAKDGAAVLVVEQKAFEALSVCDYGYVMVGGKIVLAGRGEELLRRPDIREVFLGQGPDSPNDDMRSGLDDNTPQRQGSPNRMVSGLPDEMPVADDKAVP